MPSTNITSQFSLGWVFLKYSSDSVCRGAKSLPSIPATVA